MDMHFMSKSSIEHEALKNCHPWLSPTSKTTIINTQSAMSEQERREVLVNTLYGCSSLVGTVWPSDVYAHGNYSCESLASSTDFSIPNSSDSEDFRPSRSQNSKEAFNMDSVIIYENLTTLDQEPLHKSKTKSHQNLWDDGINPPNCKTKKFELHPVLDKDTRKSDLYKTEFCRSYEETGYCRYGTKCQFAHSTSELRIIARHPKYKTVICKTFWEQGTCPYGKRCCFIHHTKPDNGEPSRGDRGSNIWQEYSFQPNSRIRRNSADMISTSLTSSREVPRNRSFTKRLPIFQHMG